jgi:hypothetical protein
VIALGAIGHWFDPSLSEFRKYEWVFQNIEIIMVQAAKLIGAGSALIA